MVRVQTDLNLILMEEVIGLILLEEDIGLISKSYAQ